MDLAPGGFWPSGEDLVLAHGVWPSGEGGPRSEGIFGSQGRIGYGHRSWGIWALWRGFSPCSRAMALSGGPLSI